MKDRKFSSLVIILVTVMLLAVPIAESYESTVFAAELANRLPDLTIVGAISPAQRIPYPNPIDGMNVTVLGVLTMTSVTPVCSPSCAIQSSTVSSLMVAGRNYRLMFSNSISVPANVNGWNAVVTGSFTTPSTFQTDQWTPPLSFYGDIHVQKISYFRTLPQ
jgi:hypothetical protein